MCQARLITPALGQIPNNIGKKNHRNAVILPPYIPFGPLLHNNIFGILTMAHNNTSEAFPATYYKTSMCQDAYLLNPIFTLNT